MKLWAQLRGLESKIEVAEKSVEQLHGKSLAMNDIVADLDTCLKEEKARGIVSIETFSKLKRDREREASHLIDTNQEKASRSTELSRLKENRASIKALYDALSKNLNSPGATVLSFKQENI